MADRLTTRSGRLLSRRLRFALPTLVAAAELCRCAACAILMLQIEPPTLA